jgi:hypothetical protein
MGNIGLAGAHDEQSAIGAPDAWRLRLDAGLAAATSRTCAPWGRTTRTSSPGTGELELSARGRASIP